VTLLLLGCGGSDSPSDIGSETSGLEREIHGFTLAETKEGKLLWELESEYAWRIPRENRIHLKDVKIVFFDANGNETSRLTAYTGVVDEETGIMTAQSRVKLISTEGDTLTTEELNYDKKKDRVSGPGFVRLAKPDRVMTGFEFEAKPDLTDYEVRRDVTITVPDRDGNVETGP
jgi:LPS export ABC transporter protein LptC